MVLFMGQKFLFLNRHFPNGKIILQDPPSNYPKCC